MNGKRYLDEDDFDYVVHKITDYIDVLTFVSDSSKDSGDFDTANQLDAKIEGLKFTLMLLGVTHE